MIVDELDPYTNMPSSMFGLPKLLVVCPASARTRSMLIILGWAIVGQYQRAKHSNATWFKLIAFTLGMHLAFGNQRVRHPFSFTRVLKSFLVIISSPRAPASSSGSAGASAEPAAGSLTEAINPKAVCQKVSKPKCPAWTGQLVEWHLCFGDLSLSLLQLSQDRK